MQSLLLDFFKVMSNEHRLRIAARLMERETTSAQLAEALKLKQNAVIDHLAALRELNLVTSRANAGQTWYAFNTQALYTLTQTILSQTEARTPVDELPDEAARKTLRNFFEGERLVMIPAHPKKLQLLLEWLVTQFETGVRYPERQVNEIIARYHEDYATLRRAMIDAGLMTRESNVYWRVEPA